MNGLRSVGRGFSLAAPCLRAGAATTAAVLIGASSTVLACPQCFGAEETTLVSGTKLGILALLGVTLAVQGGFAAFFLHLRKRAKRFADADLDTGGATLCRFRALALDEASAPDRGRSDLQRAPRTS